MRGQEGSFVESQERCPRFEVFLSGLLCWLADGILWLRGFDWILQLAPIGPV